jgi:tyrosinase
MFNAPPSANGTLDDIIDLGVLAPQIKIRDAMSTISDLFCYVYA